MEEFRQPYKDSRDRTPDVEEACREYIEEYLQQEGKVGYIIGPAKYKITKGNPYVLGIAILDPQEDTPSDLRFFTAPMEKLQFAIRPDDLIAIKTDTVKISNEGRNYSFEIQEDISNRIPNIQGRFSFDDMSLDLE